MNHFTKRTLLAAMAAASFGSIADKAVADKAIAENAAADSSDYQLKTVTVTGKKQLQPALDETSESGSRLDLTLREIPASVEIISGGMLRILGDVSVSSAVSRATGITWFGTPGDGGTALSARGFTGHGSVMQLYDGSQLAVGAGTVTFPFDTWSVDHIEVLRGPSSVLYGQGAIGGAINVIPKKPSQKQSTEVEAAWGSYDSARLSFGAGGPIGDAVSYRVDLNRKKSNGWMDRGDSESLAISGALRWDITQDLAVTLSHDSGSQEPQTFFGTPLIDGKLRESLRDNNYNVRDGLIDYDDRITRLKLNWSATDTIRVSSETYRLETDRHWRNAETYVWDAETNLVSRYDYLEIIHEETQTGNRSDIAFDSDIGSLKNSFLIGFDVSKVKFRYPNNFNGDNESVTDLDNADPGYFLNPQGTTLGYKTDTDLRAIFAEDRLQLTDDWSLVAGLRHDEADFDREDVRTPANSFDETYSSSSWRLGSVYELTEEVSLYGQYSTGADPVTSLITTSISRKDFDVAKARQIEVGLKQVFWDKRAEWTLAFYDIEKKDLLSHEPGNPTALVQVGQQSSRGVEVSATVLLLEQLRIDANATVLNAEYDEFADGDDDGLITYDGNTPSDVPERTANLWFIWDVNSAWQTSAGVRYVGKRYSDFANDYEMPGYSVVDAGVAWKAARHTTLALHVLNAFDKVYTQASYGDEQWILGAPRTVEVSANLKF